MPAEVDNATIREGVNQVIQAILDLIPTITTESWGTIDNLRNDMTAGFDGVIEAIGNIKVSSGGGGCGGCSGGTGELLDDDPAEGQPDEPGDGPGGYPPPASWDDEGGSNPFDPYKCKAANFIYDSIALTLDFLGSFSTVGGAIEAGSALGSLILASVTSHAASTIGVVGVSVFAVLTGWEVALIVSLIAAASLVVGVPLLLAFNYTRTELANHKEDFVCALYNARDLPAAKTAAADILTEVVTLFDIGELSAYDATVRQLVQDVIDYWLPNTLINKLFEEDPTIRDTYSPSDPIDCSECGSEEALWSINILICTPTVTSGDFSEGTPTTVEHCVGNYFGTDRAGQNSGSQPVETTERDVLIQDVVGGGSFYVTRRISGVDVSDPMTAAELEGQTFTCSQLQIIRLDASDTTPFTITYVVTLA